MIVDFDYTIAAKIRKLNYELEKRKLRITQGGGTTTTTESTKFADDGEEDIHLPFVKCPVENRRCYYTYHQLCPDTLKQHLKNEHAAERIGNS